MSDQQLQNSYEMLFDALDNMEEGLVVYDVDGYLLACNRAFRNMYSYTEQEAAPGVHCDELGVLDVIRGNSVLGDENGEDEDDFFQRKWAYREKLQGSLTVKLQDGRWIRTTDRAMPNGGFVSVQVDVTEIKHAQEQIQQAREQLIELNSSLEQQVKDRTAELEQAKQIAEAQARTDPLTGIQNRRAFFESAQKVHQQTSEGSKNYLLLVIDIDNFKSANDTYGHLVGDQVIVVLAEVIQSMVQAPDISGRLGGDEFTVLIAESTVYEVKRLAKQLSSRFVNKLLAMDKQLTNLTLSIGIAECNADSRNLNQVLEQADKALYSAKKQGKNCIKFAIQGAA